MGEPKYRLEGIVHTRSDAMEDFEGPLDVIFLLLSKNKIEIQDLNSTITEIRSQVGLYSRFVLAEKKSHQPLI